MSFTVIIPARLASTRLPVIIATDHEDILAACRAHGVEALMTRSDHPSGTDRIAEVAAAIGLAPDAVVVNVQGDEPLIDPALVAATAALITSEVPMATAAHPISAAEDVFNPNVVKVVLDAKGRALYFSRAAIPWHRDGFAQSSATLPAGYRPLRHIGLYAYSQAFLQAYPALAVSPLEQVEALEQLRVLWNGYPIAVHLTDAAPAAGIDTPEDLARARRHYEGNTALS